MLSAQHSSSDGSELAVLSALPNLAAALRHTVQHFSADVGTVHVLDSEGLLHLAASEGIPDGILENIRTVPVGKGIAGRAIERRQVVSAANLQLESLFAEAFEGVGVVRGAVALPIFRDDAVIGALGLGTTKEHPFSEPEIAALLEVGRSMAERFIGSPQSTAL